MFGKPIYGNLALVTYGHGKSLASVYSGLPDDAGTRARYMAAVSQKIDESNDPTELRVFAGAVKDAIQLVVNRVILISYDTNVIPETRSKGLRELATHLSIPAYKIAPVVCLAREVAETAESHDLRYDALNLLATKLYAWQTDPTTATNTAEHAAFFARRAVEDSSSAVRGKALVGLDVVTLADMSGGQSISMVPTVLTQLREKHWLHPFLTGKSDDSRRIRGMILTHDIFSPELVAAANPDLPKRPKEVGASAEAAIPAA